MDWGKPVLHSCFLHKIQISEKKSEKPFSYTKTNSNENEIGFPPISGQWPRDIETSSSL